MTELKIETTELKEIAINCNVDVKQAEEITLGLNPFIEERALLIQEFDEVSKLEITKENIPTFKTLRLKFQKNRTQGINNWHKVAKEIPLRMGQLIDAVKRNQIQINETHEQFLEDAEKHFEIEEQKRLDALQLERVEMLSPYVEDAHERNLSGMELDVWNAYFGAKQKEYTDRIEAEKQAEKERIEKEKARIAEEKRIREENERLEKEAKEAELKRIAEQKERDRLEKIRLEKEESERKKREAKAEKERKEFEAKLQAEREAKEKIEREEKLKREKLQAELKAKEEAEQKEKQRLINEELNKVKAEKKARLAPDKDKLLKFAEHLESIELPELKSMEAGEILNNIVTLINKTTDYIKEKAENL